MEKLIKELYQKYCDNHQHMPRLPKDILERIGQNASPNTQRNLALATKEYTLKIKTYARHNADHLVKFFQNLDKYIQPHPKYNKSGFTQDLFTLYHKSQDGKLTYTYSVRLYKNQGQQHVILVKSYTNYKRPRESYMLNYEYSDSNGPNFTGTRLTEMMPNKSLQSKQEIQNFLSNIQDMSTRADLKEWKEYILQNKPEKYVTFEWTAQN